MESDVLLDGRRRSETRMKLRIPTVWFSLKRSLTCKSQPAEVHEPEDRSNPRSFIASKLLKNVIHGTNKKQILRPTSSSPSTLSPVPKDRFGLNRVSSCTGAEFISPSPRKSSTRFDRPSNQSFSPRASLSAINGCLKCGESFSKFEGLEAHHLSKHAVTELEEGNSSRKVVEMICRSSWMSSQTSFLVERILKVHCTQKTLSAFEEHRNAIKFREGKLLKKHPRCLADGNELLRFHGTAMSCDLGAGSSRGLCASNRCGVCRIIRHGFSTEGGQLGSGVFTASTSAAALKSVEIRVGDRAARKALLICRVIAGRVHRPPENWHEIGSVMSDFDSLAGKVGAYSSIEELYLLNPRAILPCFVVICKSW